MPMRKSEFDRKLSNNSPRPTVDINAASRVKYLSAKSLQCLGDIPNCNDPHERLPTPKELISNYQISSLAISFPRLLNQKLPIVREVGVKAAIIQLADILCCNDYKSNLIQFWFVDIVTDCLWRIQDEFLFPEKHQKIILEWILYIFNLIRAQQLNLSRNMLFKLFEEALAVAEDSIETGCDSIPLPEELFGLKLESGIDSEEQRSVTSSGSSISFDKILTTDSYLAIKFDNAMERFILPKKKCVWDSDEECLSSSVESASEDEYPSVPDNTSQSTIYKGEYSFEEEIDFYQPDMGIPSRFLPSKESLYESSSISYEISEHDDSNQSSDATWIAKSPHTLKVPCPSQMFDYDVEEMNVKKAENDIIQAWYDYHLWQYRKQNMANPKKGSVFCCNHFPNRTMEFKENEETVRLKTEWEAYLQDKKEETRSLQTNIFINTCVIFTIKQLVYDYFYENFQYKLLKIAFRYPHHYITQEINAEWCIPKLFKGELKKPVAKKPKKEKKVKEPKPKKEKKDKPQELKSNKQSKSSKESKKTIKDDKQDKKGKRDKPKVQTKEEKLEQIKQQQEELRLAEEKKREEENKIFMFPLTEAVDDKFFEHIFQNWVKPKKGTKGIKDNKPENKDKKSKDKKSNDKKRKGLK